METFFKCIFLLFFILPAALLLLLFIAVFGLPLKYFGMHGVIYAIQKTLGEMGELIEDF